MASNAVRIELLNRDNYDTWKIQMQALLTKNETWDYVNGRKPKSKVTDTAAGSAEEARRWEIEDGKARADIILSIKPSELKQVKDCNTSHELWRKLQSIYQSSGPARKATLIKQLSYHHLQEGSEVREHLERFFDTIDRLKEMDVEINPDLLSVMLLHSLPPSFENFRCAIESRDALPTPDILRIKILEEDDARKHQKQGEAMNAMFAKNRFGKNRGVRKKNERAPKNDATGRPQDTAFKFKCHRCRKVGHKAAECKETFKESDNAKAAEDISLCAIVDYSSTNGTARSQEITETVFQAKTGAHGSVWYMDSGCTAHMCSDKGEFEEIQESLGGKVNLASEASTDIEGKGSVSWTMSLDGVKKRVKLNEALHVPKLRTNLLSVGKICDRGFKIVFEREKATVVDAKGGIVMKADRDQGGLYCVKTAPHEMSANAECYKKSIKKLSLAEIWHRKLGHINYRDLWKCHQDKAVIGLKLDERRDEVFCDTCVKGKMTRTPFPKESTKKTEILEIIHSDICGPMRNESNGKARYFITFIDNASRWCEVRFLRNKSDAFQAFKDYRASVENLTGKRIKYLQSDNGKEYINESFDIFLRMNGIGRRLSVTHTPEQNGVAERKNRTLLDVARCLLLNSSLPKTFWAEAINTANHIRNRCPTSYLNGGTPYEKWKGQIPNVGHFQIFGSEVQTLIREPNKGKFEPRSRKGIFIGYSETSKGYRVWLPDEKRVDIARDIKFVRADPCTTEVESDVNSMIPPTSEPLDIEYDFPFECVVTRNPNEETTDTPLAPDREQQVNDLDGNEDDTEDYTPKRGRGRPRIIRTGLRGRPRKLFHRAELVDGCEEAMALTEVSINDAIHGSDAEEWYKAIACEVRSLLKNDTWQLVNRPEQGTVIGSKFVLRNKYKENGYLERRKARVVAKGFAQRPGVDFDDTFAPVARIESIRILMALAAERGMFVEQLDVTTAYLNGILNEEIFLEVPKHLRKGLEMLAENKQCDIGRKAIQMLQELQDGDKVCRLNKALYGLRQAGRCWNDRLSKILDEFGASKSTADPCVYSKGQGRDQLIVATYVDDIIVISQNKSEIHKVKRFLSSRLDLKCLGPLKYCLGIEFAQSETGSIAMTQRGYIKDILKRFGMSDANPVSTPLDPNVKLNPSREINGESEKLPYRELVGALTYIANCTRPDISFATSYLSQFGTCYNASHWTAAKRVLRYLKGSLEVGLKYTRTGDYAIGYTDADWANCPIDRRSYTGFAFIFGGCSVAWESRKQRTVALSSTEAEYMALTEAAKQATYLQRFLKEVGHIECLKVTILCDNCGARKIAENPVFHNRTKHIDVRHHYVREVLRSGLLGVEYIPTEDMASDILTKGTPAPKHGKCVTLLGLRRIED